MGQTPDTQQQHPFRFMKYLNLHIHQKWIDYWLLSAIFAEYCCLKNIDEEMDQHNWHWRSRSSPSLSLTLFRCSSLPLSLFFVLPLFLSYTNTSLCKLLRLKFVCSFGFWSLLSLLLNKIIIYWFLLLLLLFSIIYSICRHNLVCLFVLLGFFYLRFRFHLQIDWRSLWKRLSCLYGNKLTFLRIGVKFTIVFGVVVAVLVVSV